MSRESEAGEIISSEAVESGCDASPILSFGEHAFDDVSALGGAIIQVSRAPAQADLTRVRTVASVDYAVIRRSRFPALSRRKAAIRNFDAARALAITQRPYEA